MEESLVRYLHFLGIIILASALVSQHLLISTEMSRDQFKKLRFMDRLYGGGASITFIAGLLLWFFVGKSAAFYSGNPVFHVKVTLFVVIGAISIIPTIFYAKQSKLDTSTVMIPTHIVMLIRVQLLGLLILPLLAVLMARGIGA